MFLQSTDKIVGRYSITKCGADTSVLEHYEFNNLIIPSVLAQASQRGLIEVIGIGSGIEAPTENDTNLNAPISGQWTVAYMGTEASYDVVSSQPTLSYNYYGLIPEGIAIANIREFAMFDAENIMFSRALLKAGDEQLTLSKGESEYIEIRYSVIFKLPQGVQPVKTMTINGQVIQVTSRAFANASGIGRFDGGDIIDGIYVNGSETPALGDNFQPNDSDILPVTLKDHQILGREDVQYASGTLVDAIEIYEIVVKSQLGWFSYRFSPALQLPLSSKWSMGFGMQWATNAGAYVKAPEMMVLSVSDEIMIASNFVATNYNLGELPEDEPLTFVGKPTSTNTSAELRATTDIELGSNSIFRGYVESTNTYKVALADYFGLSVFKLGRTYSTWIKEAISTGSLNVSYAITFAGESVPAYTFTTEEVLKQFHVENEEVFFTPVMKFFSSTHHVLVSAAGQSLEFNIAKSGYFESLFSTPFEGPAQMAPFEGNSYEFTFDKVRIDSDLVTYFFGSTTVTSPPTLMIQGAFDLSPQALTQLEKMEAYGFGVNLDVDMGRIPLSMAELLGMMPNTILIYMVHDRGIYSFFSTAEPRDIFTFSEFIHGETRPPSAKITFPDSDDVVNEIATGQAFDILVNVPGGTLGTILTVDSPVDANDFNLRPLFPFEVLLSSESIRIKFTRG